MADETKVTEKVYCYDHPSAYNQGNNAALCAALMNQKDSPAEMAAMMNGGFGGMGGMQWLVWLYAMRWLGDDRNKDNAQLAALQNQISDNQNINNVTAAIQNNASAMREIANATNTNIDFVKQSLCNLNSAVQQVGGAVGLSSERVINAVQSGNAAVTSALQNCCCQTQQAILKMGYENQLANCQQTNTLQNGQRDLGQAITQGFSSTAYETQKQTCDIINAGAQNTQRIIDTLNCHWQQDLQQRYNDARLELSQQRQNAALIAALKTTTTTTATA